MQLKARIYLKNGRKPRTKHKFHPKYDKAQQILEAPLQWSLASSLHTSGLEIESRSLSRSKMEIATISSSTVSISTLAQLKFHRSLHSTTSRLSSNPPPFQLRERLRASSGRSLGVGTRTVPEETVLSKFQIQTL